MSIIFKKSHRDLVSEITPVSLKRVSVWFSHSNYTEEEKRGGVGFVQTLSPIRSELLYDLTYVLDNHSSHFPKKQCERVSSSPCFASQTTLSSCLSIRLFFQ